MIDKRQNFIDLQKQNRVVEITNERKILPEALEADMFGLDYCVNSNRFEQRPIEFINSIKLFKRGEILCKDEIESESLRKKLQNHEKLNNNGTNYYQFFSGKMHSNQKIEYFVSFFNNTDSKKPTSTDRVRLVKDDSGHDYVIRAQDWSIFEAWVEDVDNDKETDYDFDECRLNRGVSFYTFCDMRLEYPEKD